MRVSDSIAKFLHDEFTKLEPEAEVYLFGSRVDENKKGGDIDVLVLTREKLSFRQISAIRVKFYDTFGFQKIDVVNFPFAADDPFKSLILMEAVKL